MPLYHFGGFEFDSATGELRGTGGRVRLRPQPARALEHLLARPGELVSRGELQRAVWPEGTFVHFDYGLNSCMKQIRAALGDNRSAPAYIETLVKRGFRFIASVHIAEAPASCDWSLPPAGPGPRIITAAASSSTDSALRPAYPEGRARPDLEVRGV